MAVGCGTTRGKAIGSKARGKMDVTREEFEAYERIRKSGAFNMATEAREAARRAGLSYERYWEVIWNYDRCVDMYRNIEGKRTEGE